MQMVDIDATPARLLAPTLGEQRYAALRAVAGAAAVALRGRAVVNVNSTARGGGVAEMLVSLLAYSRGAGIDARWAVVDGPPEFFALTKRVHNRVHGHVGDGLALGEPERRLYDEVLAAQADELVATLRPEDVVVLHDPQTLGLAPALRRAGARVVWRSHIGADTRNDRTIEAWQFLAPYLDDVDAVVVSRAGFAPPTVARDAVRVIPPSIDPLAVKNRPLDAGQVIRLLGHAGLVQAAAGEAPTFEHRDGSLARLTHPADVVRHGAPPAPQVPLVVQVSRWDRLKDMAGVLEGFATHVAPHSDAHLVLAGPDVSGVADDPEGAQVLAECIATWRALPQARRERIHLACLPTVDVDENAVLVNALQRHATVVTQKSLAEGFGLTVAEAMWKSRPVVAGAVGGIRDQIDDASCGVLLDDPTDLVAFGAQVRRLVEDPPLARRIGAAAHERARAFLPDVHLTLWARLLMDLAGVPLAATGPSA